MKYYFKQFITFLTITFIALATGCGGGGSSSDSVTGGELLTKITPLVEASIPKYTAAAKKSNVLKDWSDFSGEDDPHLNRYLGDDGCSLFTNAEFYDIIVNFINSKVNGNFESSDAKVTITTKTSITIPVWGAAPITGNFHDIDFGSLELIPDELQFTGSVVTLKNIRAAVEKTESGERVYLFTEVYFNEELSTISSDSFEKNGEMFKYEERYFEHGSTENDGEGHIYIEKAADGDFINKRLYYNTNKIIDRAIVTGNLKDNFYIRVSGGTASAGLESGGTDAITEDECFQVKSSNFSRLLPLGVDGSAAYWGGSFPADVDESKFDGFDIRDLIVSDDASDFQWW